MSMYYRDRALQVCEEVGKQYPGRTREHVVRRALDEAYPFLELPQLYTVWREVRDNYLKERFPRGPGETPLFEESEGKGKPREAATFADCAVSAFDAA